VCIIPFQSNVTLCTLGVGATFGESILQDLPRDTTVVTQTTCELLRVEQQDFKLIWEVSSCIMLVRLVTRALRKGRLTLQILDLTQTKLAVVNQF